MFEFNFLKLHLPTNALSKKPMSQILRNW
uniref:Uncharacterized protein n=1 Tax=Rhizophora mucronata TaxID=61149 RepID=A0A2P2QT04_RHIMU